MQSVRILTRGCPVKPGHNGLHHSKTRTRLRAPPSGTLSRIAGEGLPLPSRGEVLGVEEGAQFPRAARVLQFAQRLRLDLAYALARHRELLADLFQGVVGVHADAEAHAQ